MIDKDASYHDPSAYPKVTTWKSHDGELLAMSKLVFLDLLGNPSSLANMSESTTLRLHLEPGTECTKERKKGKMEENKI